MLPGFHGPAEYSRPVAPQDAVLTVTRSTLLFGAEKSILQRNAIVITRIKQSVMRTS
jgi:hypothetical protein